MQKTRYLKARCDEELEARVKTVATLEKLDESDIVRRACDHYTQTWLANVRHTTIRQQAANG